MKKATKGLRIALKPCFIAHRLTGHFGSEAVHPSGSVLHYFFAIGHEGIGGMNDIPNMRIDVEKGGGEILFTNLIQYRILHNLLWQTHAHTHTHTHAYTRARTLARTPRTLARTHTRTHTRTHVHTHTRARTHGRPKRTRARTHACMHARTHTHTHKHTLYLVPCTCPSHNCGDSESYALA